VSALDGDPQERRGDRGRLTVGTLVLLVEEHLELMAKKWNLTARQAVEQLMQPVFEVVMTKHPTNNPYPNLALGLELATSAHSFQFFAGNYNYITPSRNNYYNQNDYSKGEFLIGFNITRLWNY